MADITLSSHNLEIYAKYFKKIALDPAERTIADSENELFNSTLRDYVRSAQRSKITINETDLAPVLDRLIKEAHHLTNHGIEPDRFDVTAIIRCASRMEISFVDWEVADGSRSYKVVGGHINNPLLSPVEEAFLLRVMSASMNESPKAMYWSICRIKVDNLETPDSELRWLESSYKTECFERIEFALRNGGYKGRVLPWKLLMNRLISKLSNCIKSAGPAVIQRDVADKPE